MYLFLTAVGLPLVLWTLLSGGDDAGADADPGDAEGGPIMLRILPLSSIALAAAASGVTGLALGALDVGAGATLVAAVVIGVLAAALNSAAFAVLRRTADTSDVSATIREGALARVVLPVGPGRRGRVVVDVGGQPIYLTAEAVDGAELVEAGAEVVVLSLERGTARVARLELPSP